MGRSVTTLNKATVQATYKTQFTEEYVAENGSEPTEDQIAAAVEANASFLYKFTAPAAGTIMLVSNNDTNNSSELTAAGFSKISGSPANAAMNTTKTTDYTYTKDSYFHAKGQTLAGYKISNSIAVENTSFSGIETILTQPYDYMPPATETNSYACLLYTSPSPRD